MDDFKDWALFSDSKASSTTTLERFQSKIFLKVINSEKHTLQLNSATASQIAEGMSLISQFCLVNQKYKAK